MLLLVMIVQVAANNPNKEISGLGSITPEELVL
jgi:hypothetical protein